VNASVVDALFPSESTRRATIAAIVVPTVRNQFNCTEMSTEKFTIYDDIENVQPGDDARGSGAYYPMNK